MHVSALNGTFLMDRHYVWLFSFLITATSRPSSGYVGLVNQAMTCYLNSLLQALFMTPEFRNALYNWEFDNSDPTKNIPYQLQRLFVNLQASDHSYFSSATSPIRR